MDNNIIYEFNKIPYLYLLDQENKETKPFDNIKFYNIDILDIPQAFFKTKKEIYEYISEQLTLLEFFRNDKNQLKNIRKDNEQKLLFSFYSGYSSIIFNAFHHVYSELNKILFYYNVKFINKLRNYRHKLKRYENEICQYNNYFIYNYYYTPSSNEFKWELGRYIYLRINEKKDLSPEDYVFLYDKNITKYGIDNLNFVIEAFNYLLLNFEKEKGEKLINYFLKKYNSSDFQKMKRLKLKIKEMTRQAENIVRQEKNLPKVGEGWIEETNLYYLLRKNFPNLNIIHHGKPKFLKKQHFDIWIPKYNIAIEYQGEQHYKPIDYFGGIESYKKQEVRDKKKYSLCKENNVELIYIKKDYKLNEILNKINSLIKKYNYKSTE